jgi:hypothetical protein
MPRSRSPRTVRVLALAVSLLGLAGVLMVAGADLSPARPADAVATDTSADTGADTGGREVVGTLAHRVDVVSSRPAWPDRLPRGLRHAGAVLAVAGAGLAALACRPHGAVDVVPAAVPSAATAHVRRRGPPSVIV